MESYIFNCYQKWLKEKNGNIFRQLSKRNKVVNVLLLLLLATLIVMVITYALFIFQDLNELWGIASTIAELIVVIIIYVYTSRDEIKNSFDNLKSYKEHCDKLNDMPVDNHVTHSLISQIIIRYKSVIEEMNKKMEFNYERVNKFMQIITIPLSVVILGSLLKVQPDSESVLVYGFSISGLIAIFYGFLVLAVFFCNEGLANRQNKYKYFVNDLQSILDLEECDACFEKIV